MTTREEYVASAERNPGIIGDLLRVYADHPDYTGWQAFTEVCHLQRDDGTKLPCYALLHEDKRDVLATHSGLREVDPLYAAWYERQLAERPEGHAAHKKRSVQWLMHPSHCPECGTKKIRYMAAQPEESHIGRNGRRLAETYGVK